MLLLLLPANESQDQPSACLQAEWEKIEIREQLEEQLSLAQAANTAAEQQQVESQVEGQKSSKVADTAKDVEELQQAMRKCEGLQSQIKQLQTEVEAGHQVQFPVTSSLSPDARDWRENVQVH